MWLSGQRQRKHRHLSPMSSAFVICRRSPVLTRRSALVRRTSCMLRGPRQPPSSPGGGSGNWPRGCGTLIGWLVPPGSGGGQPGAWAAVMEISGSATESTSCPYAEMCPLTQMASAGVSRTAADIQFCMICGCSTSRSEARTSPIRSAQDCVGHGCVCRVSTSSAHPCGLPPYCPNPAATRAPWPGRRWRCR
jgi:hypothetical protein